MEKRLEFYWREASLATVENTAGGAALAMSTNASAGVIFGTPSNDTVAYPTNQGFTQNFRHATFALGSALSVRLNLQRSNNGGHQTAYVYLDLVNTHGAGLKFDVHSYNPKSGS